MVQMKSVMVGFRVGLVALLCVAGACSKDPQKARQEYLESGNALAEQKKYADAIVQYRNALRADPKFGEARKKLADAYIATGDVRRAVQEQIRAADLLPNDADAQVKAGAIVLVAGRFEDAKARALQALKADPKHVPAQILLGNATAGLKDLDGALKEMEEAISLAPQDSRAYTALGAVQLAKGEAESAEKTFRQAVEVDPKAVPARLALANFLWASNRRPEALVAFQEALKVDPTNKLANRALASFHASGPTPADAEPYFKALADDPADTAARVTLADFYSRLGKVKEARELLTKVGAEKDGFAAARIRLAGLAFAEKNSAEAHRLIDEVLAKDSKNVDALLVRARLQRADHRLREALSSTQAATTAAPDSMPAHYERALSELSLNQLDEGIKSLREAVRLNPRVAAPRLQLANALLRKREFSQARTAAEDALRLAPNDPTARLTVARAEMGTGDAAAASRSLATLQKDFPDAAIVWSQMGALKMLQRDPKGARAAFDKALSLRPGQYEALQGLTLLDLRDRKPEAAFARLEPLLTRTPDNIGYLQLAANIYAAQRNFPKAESALRRILELDSTNMETYGRLGRLYIMQGRTNEALKEFEALSKQRPNDVGPHTVVAMLLQSTNKLNEAQERYERVIAIDPQAPVAANNLAWLYAERGGNLDMALQLAQAARRGLPENPAVADTLGWIYYKKQLYDQAIRELGAAVEKDPDNPEYQYHLGAAYAAKGDVAKARTALQKAVATPFSASEDARKALSALPAQGA